jgi:hypothetical protein
MVLLRSWVGKLLLVFLSVLFALSLSELLVRSLPLTQGRPGDVKVITEYDSLLGWRKIANASRDFVTEEYRITEHINSMGIRGPEYSKYKPPGEYRILLLGDSFTEGYTVDFPDLCSEVLKRRLNQLGSGSYEVINTGTRGYSTDQELLALSTDGGTYNPDLIVLMFYINDVLFNSQPRYWRGFKPVFDLRDGELVLTGVPVPRPDTGPFAHEIPGGTGLAWFFRRTDAWLGVRSRLYRLLRGRVTNTPILNAAAIRLGWAEVPNEFRPWKKVPDEALDHAWRLTKAILTRLADEAESLGSELVIFHVPTRESIYPGDWESAKRRFGLQDEQWSVEQDRISLKRTCDELAFNCIFPVGRFRAEAKSLQEEGKRLYFLGDDHWTVEGHRLVGEIIADYVRRLREEPR